MCLHKHVLVLQRGLPSLDGELERFITKSGKKWLPNSSRTDYSALANMTLSWPGSKHETSNYYTNMTSQWGFHQDLLPRVRIVARGRQSSRGEIIPGGNPTGMSYLGFIIPNKIQNTKARKITNTRDFG